MSTAQQEFYRIENVKLWKKSTQIISLFSVGQTPTQSIFPPNPSPNKRLPNSQETHHPVSPPLQATLNFFFNLTFKP